MGLSLVTLGVGDLPRAIAFYEGMGFDRAARAHGGVAFFRAGGVVLSLYPRAALAADAGIAVEGSTGFALAVNQPSPAAVEAVLGRAVALGARLVRPGQAASWGGYLGYFADPDGHLWEVAHNPGFPLAADGRVTLPD